MHLPSAAIQPVAPRNLFRQPDTPSQQVVAATGVGAAMRWAISFLEANARSAEKPAVVLDIDGTILVNYRSGVTRRACGLSKLAKTCAKHGIEIFIITGRPDEPKNRRWTKRQLAKCQIAPIAKLYMRPPGADYGACKFNQRQEIKKNGHAILLSVGDQWRDLRNDDAFDELGDDKTFIGTIGDAHGYAIKLPLERIRAGELAS